MSDIFFEEPEIPKPDYHLGVGSGPHGKKTGECLAKFEEVLIKEQPDFVQVYGDTNSTLAGGLAAGISTYLFTYGRQAPDFELHQQ